MGKAFWIFMGCIVAILGLLFWPAFMPGHVLFSNDNPLGRCVYDYNYRYEAFRFWPIKAIAIFVLFSVCVFIVTMLRMPPPPLPKSTAEDCRKPNWRLPGCIAFCIVLLAVILNLHDQGCYGHHDWSWLTTQFSTFRYCLTCGALDCRP